jgi:hypothetical protein
MVADLERAHDFVLTHGDAGEQARLHYLWTGEAVPDPLIAGLLAGQRSDGGWPPFWAPDYSGLDATCFRLARADQIGVSRRDARLRRARHFLAARQRVDGSWEEEEAAGTHAPPWARPGDPAARLYLTANCGFWLAVSGETPANANQAALFLQEQVDDHGHLPSFLHTHWLAAGLWLAVGHPALAERTLAYLATRLQDDTPAGTLSWLLTALDRAGLPTAHPLMQQAATLLEAAQAPDGRWTSEDGAAHDVHVTLEAIHALQRVRQV